MNTNIRDKHLNTSDISFSKRSIRLPGESKRDMNLRLLQIAEKKDIETYIKSVKMDISKLKTLTKQDDQGEEPKQSKNTKEPKQSKHDECLCKCEQKCKHKCKHKCNDKCKCIKECIEKCKEKCKPKPDLFAFFEGWWILTTIDDWDTATLINFFRDADGNPKAKWFDGTQTFPRELNANDRFSRQVPTTEGDQCPVEVLGPRSLRFLNFLPVLSTENLRSTFRIQDDDDNLAYAYLWSNLDGTSDDPNDGYVETLMQYRRLPGPPDNLQYNHLPSKVDWTDPVNMFLYIKDFWGWLTQPQKTYSLNQVNWIGWDNYNALFDTFLKTGVVRTARSSTAYRGGKWIGVWKTQFPDDFPITTIHTEEVHHFNECSSVTITGFKGAYAILNGTHKVAPNPPSAISDSTPYPWQVPESRQPFIYVDVDTSGIQEDYNPNIHGIATLEARHGPITSDIGYREFMAAVIDFAVTSFGPGTHTRVRVWYNASTNTIPETFIQLKEGIADGTLTLLTIRFRTYQSNSFNLYWSPSIINRRLAFPTFNLNDPFGLGMADFDPYFSYDIPLFNYLDIERTYNMFFAITGPILPDQPITGMLVDKGYPNNGSEVVWTVNKWGIKPYPLIDEFGTHEYRYYAAADGDPDTEESAALSYFGGIVRPEFSNGQVIAYIRIQSEDGPDAPIYEVVTRPLVFGPKNFPARATGIWTAAWASLTKQLNSFNPDRFILDIRNNAGGFAQADIGIAALFGDDRPGDTKFLAFAGPAFNGPLLIDPNVEQTVFNALSGDKGQVLVRAAEAAFPGSTVRSTTKRIDLIVLDSTHSASGGDEFPHYYIGPDPNSQVHDLGGNVICRIFGDIDGRLWSGVKLYDGLALDPINHNLKTASGEPRTATYLVGEAGILMYDRHGSIANQQTWTIPALLLPGWFDQTEWQDIGVTPVKLQYPLNDIKPNPTFDNRTTWRDVWLEYALTK